MLRPLEAKWGEIKRSANDGDEFRRTAALAAGVGFLEVGLAALGIARQGREGLQERLRRVRFGEFRGAPEGIHLKTAIEARNHAVHDHAVAPASECRQHLATLHRAWGVLRQRFVTKRNAAMLAQAILETGAVSDVFLFGSLAIPYRGCEPHDIDLLLFDNGEYSSWMGQYDLGPEAHLEEGVLASPAMQAAVRCGWLDYIFVDGTRFGTNREYTLSLAQNQPDPLFFVNISTSLRAFDQETARWMERPPQVFARLAAIRRQLEVENIVPAPGTRRRTSSRPPRR